MGLDLTSADAYLPAAIGGISQQTCCSPLQMADAYAAIANGGMLVQPRLVTQVVGPDGTVLGTDPIRYKQVVDPRIAYVMTQVLEAVMSPTIYDEGLGHGWDSNWGTGYDADVQDNVPGWPSAGKTGTTDNNTDLWFVGYTPLYTAAVWVGYDNQQEQVPNDAYGDTYAGPIWQKVMEDAVAPYQPVQFPQPSGVVEAPVDAKCAPWHVCSPTALTPPQWIQEDWFVSGTQPTPATNDTLWKEYAVTATTPPLLWNPACGGQPVMRVYLNRSILGESWAEPIAFIKGTGWAQYVPVDMEYAPPTEQCAGGAGGAATGGQGAAGNQGGVPAGCAEQWTVVVQAGQPADPSLICIVAGQTATLHFVTGDGQAYQVSLPSENTGGSVAADGTPLDLAVTPAAAGSSLILMDGLPVAHIEVAPPLAASGSGGASPGATPASAGPAGATIPSAGAHPASGSQP
jgi:penicillin-binding protein 1A